MNINDTKYGFSKLTAGTFFFLSIVIVSAILSIFKQYLLKHDVISSNFSTIIPALLFSSAIYFILVRKLDRTILYLLSFTFFLFWASSLYTDFSFDGLAYHQKASWYLWHEGKLFYDYTGDSGSIWVGHYPKLLWYFSGELAILFSKMDYGMSYQFIIAASLFLYSLNFFNSFNYKKIFSYIFSILIVFNPIFFSQVFTYYVDSTVGYLSCIIILSTTLYIRKRQLSDLLLLSTAAAIVINIKFSGFIYAGIGFLFVGVFSLSKIKEYKRIILSFLGFFIIGVMLIGYNPYVSNVLAGKHPFSPLFGANSIDIITTQSPASFEDKNRFEKLFISIFSKTEDLTYQSENQPKLKIPGAVSGSEIYYSSLTDVRIGGFGPLFSLAFILSIIYLIYNKFGDENVKILLLIIVSAIILNPESWWARYSPHTYLLILLPLMTNSVTKIKFTFILLICIITSLNTLICLSSKATYLNATEVQMNTMLSECKNKTINILPNFDFLVEPILDKYTSNYTITQDRTLNYKMPTIAFSYNCE